jgi:hypothetical protein
MRTLKRIARAWRRRLRAFTRTLRTAFHRNKPAQPAPGIGLTLGRKEREHAAKGIEDQLAYHKALTERTWRERHGNESWLNRRERDRY